MPRYDKHFTTMKLCQKKTDLTNAIGKIAKFVVPGKEALQQKAAPLVQSYTTAGCPADCGSNWKQEHIEATKLKGPQSSTTDPQALIALQEEIVDKVKNRYATVVHYRDIKEKLCHSRVSKCMNLVVLDNYDLDLNILILK